MRVFYSSLSAQKFLKKGSVLTMGNYDGVHFGHRQILAKLVSESKKRKLPSVLYTFHPHPVKVLVPDAAPHLINTLPQKIELLQKCGLDAVVIEKFDHRYSKMSAEDFFENIVMKRLHPRFITVGYDFSFGSKKRGNVEMLHRLCFQKQLDVEIISPCLKGEILVSSSVVRNYVAEGKIKNAAKLLERPFYIDGTVIHGAHRGRGLGIPTANLKTDNELLPKNGVYATQTIIGKKVHGGATNIGVNPTFDGRKVSIETHIFNLKKKIYGQKVRLLFLDRIRDEKKFRSVEKLVKQIHEDEKKAKKILKNLL